jgi:multicomponent K+:H+ antiporter subunit A
MAAPTPVSSYLHSATMVKAGVFLLVRLWPALAGTPEWTWIIGGAGVCTLLIGAFIAIFQHDLKGLLAYSTISHLGLITTLIGIGTPLAIVAAIFHILNHATFKASLFMAAGIIDHETGTRDMRVLSGLRHALPVTATLAIVASAAMAGVPLLNGFLSKEMFFAETLLVGGDTNWWMSYAALAMGCSGGVFAALHLDLLRRARAALPAPPRAAALDALPVELLVLTCLVVGMLPGLSIEPVLHVAAVATLGPAMPEYDLAVWHGFNIPLLMSTLALAGGVLLYGLLRRYLQLQERDTVPLVHRLNGAQIYENTMLRLTRGAGWLKHLGTQRLQPQLLLLMLALLGFRCCWPARRRPGATARGRASTPVRGHLGDRRGCALVAAWVAKYHRLAALALVGGTGIVTAATFCGCRRPTWR